MYNQVILAVVLISGNILRNICVTYNLDTLIVHKLIHALSVIIDVLF